MIRVFVADDHTLFRDGLRRILSEAPDIQIVGEAPDGSVVLEQAKGARWDVLILDLNMPGLGGLDVLRQLKVTHPRLAILVLSMYAEEQYGARLLRAGASGFLAKGRSTAELIDAVRRVAAGGRYVTSSVAEHLLQTVDRPGDGPPHERLSPRGLQVFTLIIQGRSPSEIAAQLSLSPSTVSTYVASIKKELGVQTIGEIVRYASREGLL